MKYAKDTIFYEVGIAIIFIVMVYPNNIWIRLLCILGLYFYIFEMVYVVSKGEYVPIYRGRFLKKYESIKPKQVRKDKH